MYDVVQTHAFAEWLDGLRDRTAARKIARRLVRVQAGLLGDVKFFEGIGEV